MDLQRRTLGRLRLPDAVKRQSALEQEAFKLLHWRGLGSEEAFELLCSRAELAASREQIRASIARAALMPGPTRPLVGSSMLEETADERASPETLMLASESEALLDLDLARLEAAVADLAAEERLYVRLRFYETPPTPPREIARRMGRTPREVYKLRDRVMAALRQALGPDGGESGGVRPIG
jgi:DNA-directed RNA polymerase specialized sigma subunit